MCLSDSRRDDAQKPWKYKAEADSTGTFSNIKHSTVQYTAVPN